MAVLGGWTPLSGPKVAAEATHPSPLSSPVGGILPGAQIPSTSDDGFTEEACDAPIGMNCGGGTCGDTLTVNVASGALLYRYRIPENTIPIQLVNESDQGGVSTLGSAGWRSNYHRSIAKSGSVVTVTCDDGCQVPYTQDATATFTYYPNKGVDNIVEQDPVDTNLYTETLPNGLKYRYDLSSPGRLTNIIDPDGRLWTLGYTGTTLTYVQNHRSRRVTLNYLTGGTMVASFQDTAGRRTTIAYASGKISSITGPEGCVRSYEYASGSPARLNKVSDPDFNFSLITYSSGKVQTVRAVNPDDATKDLVTTFTYPSSGVAKVTNSKADSTTYAFDITDKVPTRIQDPEGNVTTWTWDSNLRVTTVVNPRGYTTRYLWEGVTGAGADTRRRLKALNPSSTGFNTTYSYTSGYELESIQDPQGKLTTFTYTNRHLQSLKNALNEITTWNYSSNVLSSVEDALNRRTTYTFGSNGMVSQVEDAEGKVTTFGYDTAANVTQVIDALGNRVTTTYDAANRKVSIEDQEGNTTAYAYTGCGLLRSEMDPRGYRTTFTYDHNGDRTEVQDALGNWTTIGYDKARNLLTEKNARGKVTTYGYDKLGRRTSMQDALGQPYTYTYDKNGNLLSLRDPSNAITSQEYDSLDRREVKIDPLGHRTTFTYDKSDNRTSVKDARNNITTYVYDALNRVKQVTQPDGGVTTNVFDAVGNVQATVDARGNRTTATFDKTHHLVETLNALSQRTTYTYNAVYDLTAVKNARGAIITRTFDKARRLVAVQDALGNRTTSIYDVAGNRTGMIDARTNRWTFAYDKVNRLTEVTNPLLETTTSTYDAVGNVTEVCFANNERITGTFDALNRLETMKNPAGNVQTYIYDDVGRTNSAIDFNGHRSTQTYDARWMLSTERTAELIVVTFTYDEVGNRKSARDGKGQCTTYSYTSLNLPSEVQDPLNYRTTFTYDQAGNRTLQRDADANRTTYTYDELNRLKQVDYTGSQATFTYDEVGNLKEMLDPQGLLAMTYDLRNALLTKKRGSANPLTYTYDAFGNRATLVDEVGDRQTYTYDALNRLKTIKDPSGDVTTFSYDKRGRELLIQYANDTETTSSYDSTGGVSGIENHRISTPATVLARLDYTLDKAGRPTALVQGAARTTYTYDKDNRLTRERRTDPTTIAFDITYQYDKAGNRTVMVEGGSPTTYTYDGRNALTKTQDPSGLATFTYDKRGNRILKQVLAGKTTYTYDFESRLTRIDTPSASPLATYTYDVFGERLSWKKSGTLITESWDHASLVARNEGGTRTRFVLTPSQQIGGVLSQNSAGSKLVYVFNSAGTTDSLVNTTPAVTDAIVATAFGVLKGTASVNADTVLKYVGRPQYLTDFDSGEELLFLRTRHYDPRTGRFLEPDSIGGWADGLNLGNPYGYVNADPLALVDPWGQQGCFPIYRGSSPAFFSIKTKWGRLNAYRIKVVAKSWINPVNGNLGNPWDTPELREHPHCWMDGPDSPWQAFKHEGGWNDRPLAELQAGLAHTYDKQEPSSDVRDSRYRLYSEKNMQFWCIGSNLLYWSLEKLEAECGPEHEFVAAPPKIRWDTALIGSQAASVTWSIKGRPHFFLCAAVYQAQHRRGEYIWHAVNAYFRCTATGAGRMDLDISGSGFPSHKLWANGIHIKTIYQGPYVNLFISDPKDPELVK